MLRMSSASRPSSCLTSVLIAVAFACLPVLSSPSHADTPVDFQRDVRPILSNRCFRCHGPDAETREAELRLDKADSATAELPSGERAIVTGEPELSTLLARIVTDDEDLRMPPVETGPALTDQEVSVLQSWIQAGANYEQHWSLQPIVRPEVPESAHASASPIDHFIDSALRKQALPSNPPADKAALIRRVTLALTGLPPTPSDVSRFVANKHPLAYEQLVDRLLASPRFGERWARIWLDIARYADSAGYAQDPARTIWRYRDWVIDAYNVNKPFDQFTVEQLAGDLLPDPSIDQLLGTAFHRNTMTNSEGGTDDEEFRTAAVVDRVNTTMQVWMGLTMACAQCHDHKYDDISQREYFEVFAIFNNTQDADRGDEFPWLEELTDQQLATKQRLQDERDQLPKDGGKETAERRKELDKQIRSIRGIRTPIFRELTGSQRRESTRACSRELSRERASELSRAFRKALHSHGTAKQIVYRSPIGWSTAIIRLTARVVVNRYWELIFGNGLVATSEDFGMQGDLPSHPQLLDFLAAELMRNMTGIRNGCFANWSLPKRTSVPRRVTAQLAERDVANRWLARGPRFRMSAEMIRDQALAVSGLYYRAP